MPLKKLMDTVANTGSKIVAPSGQGNLGEEIKEKAAIKKGKETDIAGIIDRIVLSEYAPCGVLIDSTMKVVHFRGHTGRYLESAAGKPSLDIFKLAREGLLMPLRAAIYKARETKHTVKRE